MNSRRLSQLLLSEIKWKLVSYGPLIFSSLCHKQLNPILTESLPLLYHHQEGPKAWILSPEKGKPDIFVFLGTEANPSIMISLQTLLRNGKISISSFVYLKEGKGKDLRRKRILGYWMGSWGLGKTLGFIVQLVAEIWSHWKAMPLWMQDSHMEISSWRLGTERYSLVCFSEGQLSLSWRKNYGGSDFLHHRLIASANRIAIPVPFLCVPWL